MFAYYLELAWHSLARTRVLTLRLVVRVAVVSTLVLLVGQLAVLAPALRAAAVPPIVASRG